MIISSNRPARGTCGTHGNPGPAWQGDADGSAAMGTTAKSTTPVITIHSLRGGVGCSSIVVNLWPGLLQVVGKATLLIDGVLTAGQFSLMLDGKPGATWENLVGIEVGDLDDVVISELMCAH